MSFFFFLKDFLIIFLSRFCIKYALFSGLFAAKPMHHHGQDCLRLKVDVVGQKGSGKTQDKPKVEKKEKEAEEGKGRFVASGGVHNPSNRLSAGENPSETLHSPA